MDKSVDRLLKESKIMAISATIEEQIMREFSPRLNSLSYEIEYEFNELITNKETEEKIKNWIKQVKDYLKGCRKKLSSDQRWINNAFEWLYNLDRNRTQMRSQESKQINDIRKSLKTTEDLVEAGLQDIDFISDFLRKDLKTEIALIRLESNAGNQSSDIPSAYQPSSDWNRSPDVFKTNSVESVDVSQPPPPPPPPPPPLPPPSAN